MGREQRQRRLGLELELELEQVLELEVELEVELEMELEVEQRDVDDAAAAAGLLGLDNQRRNPKNLSVDVMEVAAGLRRLLLPKHPAQCNLPAAQDTFLDD